MSWPEALLPKFHHNLSCSGLIYHHQINRVFDMAMKVGIALALLVVAFFASSEAAPYIQDPTESTEIIVPPESAPYVQDTPDTEPLQCPNPISVNVLGVRVEVCRLTATTCGSVKVQVGSIANVDVGVCRRGSGEWKIKYDYLCTNKNMCS